MLTVNVQWTKTDTRQALTARVEPSSIVGNVGNVGATFETVAASVRTTAQTMGVAATKNNANGMVLDNVPPTNDDELNYLDSDVACQDRREECPIGETGTTMFSWFFFDCVLDVLIKIC